MGQIQELVKQHKKKLISGVAVAILIVAVVVLLPHKPRWLGGKLPVPSDVPQVNAVVIYHAEKTEVVTSTHGFDSFSDEPKFDRAYFNEKCPIVFGSDIGFKAETIAPPEQDQDKNSKSNKLKCAKGQFVFVTTHENIGMTLDIRSGHDFYGWIFQNPDVQAFLKTEMGQGLFLSLSQVFQIRGEDLGIPKIAGPLLSSIAESALSANSRIDWVSAKGERGLVFSFDIGKSEAGAQVMFGISKYLGNKIYDVKGVSSSIVEARLGSHRIFITEEANRIYIGLNLLGVIAALESQPQELPKDVAGSVVLTVNSGAFFNGEQKFAERVKDWRNHFGFELSASKSEPSSAVILGTEFINLVQGHLQTEILRSIPFDTMAAIAISHPSPKSLQGFEWKNVIEQLDVGKDTVPGSSVMVWDFDQNANHLSAVGFATTLGTTQDQKFFSDIWADASLVATCSDGKVVLMGTTSGLLNRMKESCNRASLSVADWQKELHMSEKSQSFVMVNPAVFGREAFRFGLRLTGNETNGDSSGNLIEKRDEQKSAREELAKRVLPNFDLFPILGYAGEVTTQKTIAMTGFKKARVEK